MKSDRPNCAAVSRSQVVMVAGSRNQFQEKPQQNQCLLGFSFACTISPQQYQSFNVASSNQVA
jgi:hypothetical protein